MKLYKITTINDVTRPGKENETQWGENVTHTASGKGELCDPGFIHAYEDPRVAVFMNPVHGSYNPFRLWECEGEIVKRDGQLKCGCTSLTTIRIIDAPVITTEQRVEIAIRCAMTVYNDLKWLDWANAWLDGSDRSRESAYAATHAAYVNNDLDLISIISKVLNK